MKKTRVYFHIEMINMISNKSLDLILDITKHFKVGSLLKNKEQLQGEAEKNCKIKIWMS